MPTKRIAIRRVREMLRLTLEGGLPVAETARMRAYTNWKWRLNDVCVQTNGEIHDLWRAVDHDGEVLESFVTKTRDKAAAMKALGARDLQAPVGRWKNNRGENSHLSFPRRKRAMNRFRTMKALEKFVSIHASVQNRFSQERHLVRRRIYKQKTRRGADRVAGSHGLRSAWV